MVKTVFLLGAGASIEFFVSDSGKVLSTSSLTEVLTSDIFRLSAQLQQYISQANCYFNECYFDIFYQRILHIFKKHFRSVNGNFEHIIHLVDKIANVAGITALNLSRGNEIAFRFTNFDIALMDFFSNSFYFPIDYNFLRMVSLLPLALRFLILDFICENFKINEKYKPEWSNFFKKVLKEGQISIYSLNYDHLIYEVIFADELLFSKIELGFSKEKKFDRLNVEKLFKERNVYIPLHGSVYFVSLEDNIMVIPNCSEAVKKRADSLPKLVVNQDLSLNYNRIMITGLSKSEAILRYPFLNFYLKLAEDLASSDRVFIIGYGGGDEHINSLVKSFFKNKRVVIVTMLESVRKNIPCVLLDYELRYADELSFIEKFITFSITEFRIKNILNFKIFCSKDNQVIIYPYGTKSFLENYEKLKEILL